jgi:hypothetical protein
MTAATEPVTRVAKHSAVCAADGCRRLIEHGHLIVKRPGGGWKHTDCSRPVRKRRGEA